MAILEEERTITLARVSVLQKTRRMILLFHFRYPASSPNFTISPTLTHCICLLALALVNIR